MFCGCMRTVATCRCLDTICACQRTLQFGVRRTGHDNYINAKIIKCPHIKASYQMEVLPTFSVVVSFLDAGSFC